MDIKTKVLTEKIPEKILEKITHHQKELNNFNNDFYKLSMYLMDMQKKQLELKQKINNKTQSLRDNIKDAHTKLKLNKQIDYDWSFDGVSCFLGTPKEKK